MEDRLSKLEEDINRILERLEDFASLANVETLSVNKDGELLSLQERVASLSERFQSLAYKIRSLKSNETS